MACWNGAEVKAFLEPTKLYRLHALFVLALMTGMRRGELLGLRWDDVDFTGKRLHVKRIVVYTRGALELGEPKTAYSRRTIPIAPGVVRALLEHRERQALERKAVGYQDQGFVFASEVGTPTHPRNVERMFHNRLKHSALRRIRFSRFATHGGELDDPQGCLAESGFTHVGPCECCVHVTGLRSRV